jgi:hypothetical protein
MLFHLDVIIERGHDILTNMTGHRFSCVSSGSSHVDEARSTTPMMLPTVHETQNSFLVADVALTHTSIMRMEKKNEQLRSALQEYKKKNGDALVLWKDVHKSSGFKLGNWVCYLKID